MKNAQFKSGFVALIGRPNAGKSTLLNALLSQKISIVSKVPQTTRYLVRGVLNVPDAQIVFIDSPGIHSFRDDLSRHLNAVAKSSLQDIELIVYVVDVSRAPAREEERIMNILAAAQIPLIMALNKIDRGQKFLNEHIEAWGQALKRKRVDTDPVRYFLPLSAKEGVNLDKLTGVIKELLPAGEPFYDTETVTDFPLKFRVADTIREKILNVLRDEMPHAAAVEIGGIEDKENVTVVAATIYVNRESQKKIIVGKKGAVLKNIGILARGDLEALFNKRVYLELWVKVMPDWQKKTRVLRELGYEAS
jgi:GTP-binding protein Era